MSLLTRSRIRLRALGVAVGMIVLLALPAPGASAAAVVTASGVAAWVDGSTVWATGTFAGTDEIAADNVGLCARNSNGDNVDFPKRSNVDVSTRGLTVQESRTFAPGTYSFWACVEVAGSWYGLSAIEYFTVGANAAAARTASVSGQSMPVGDLPGWRQVFVEDFDTPLALGTFPGSYANKWLSYSGFTDTSRAGDYNQKIISAHDGVLDLYLHSENGRAVGAAPIPKVNGVWGGQTYGRFSVRMKSDELPGYGIGFLLWNDSGNWADGEIDFPESALNDVVRGYNHCPGDPARNCLVVNTTFRYSDWHTYTIDWTPQRLDYLVDDAVVGSTTSNIPNKSLHWVMQVASAGYSPSPSTSGHLLMDWATIYTRN